MSSAAFLSFNHALRDAPFAPSLVACHRAQTNAATHEIVRANLHTLPEYESGEGRGIGPRYCPSLHAKVERFAGRDSHVVWLEPEGLRTHMVYPNGLSGAFPREVQEQIVRSVAGLERAQIVRPAYDVEYEFVDPRAVSHALEARACGGPRGHAPSCGVCCSQALRAEASAASP